MAVLLGPLARRVGNLFVRGTVASVNASRKLQTVQARLLANEVKDDVEHFEAYGFTSNPLPGAEVLAAFFDGDRSHGVVVCAADRRYRTKNLASGEVALYNFASALVVLKADGSIEVTSPLKVTVTAPEVDIVAATKVMITSPLVEITGNLKVQGDITDKSNTNTRTVAGMRTQYNGHTHTDPQGGSVGAPNPTM